MNAGVYQELFDRINPVLQARFIDWEDEDVDWNSETMLWEAVKTIEKENNIFKNYAVYNRQVQRMIRGVGYDFECPALFIEIDEENCQQLPEGVTTSDLIIRFHIVMMELDSADGNLDQNVNIFQLRNQVKKWFSAFKLKQGGTFVWCNEDEDYQHDNIYHYIMAYKCFYVDHVSELKYYPYNNTNKIYIPWEKDANLWEVENANWEDVEQDNVPLTLNINGELDI